MKTSNLLIILNIISLIFASLWWYSTRDYEPVITGLALIGALLFQVYKHKKQRKSKNITMNQKSGKNSTNIQIGGDVK